MKLETAIRVLQKDAEFLGMNFLDFVQFVRTQPLAQTQRVLEAARTLEDHSVYSPFSTVNS